jgi:branched-chain amino acid transport system ATP-binding protein
VVARTSQAVHGRHAGLIRFIARVAIGTSVASVGFAFAPNVVIAVALNCVISGTLAVVGPGILVALSLAIPSRARATGFSVASLWVIPGLLILPLIGWISSHVGIRVGMLTLVPLFIIGSLILGTAQNTIDGDIAQVWQASAARSEALYQRRRGEADLLLIRNLDAGYGGRQVLFGVNFDVKEGEIVALLGTNGAGKSTLLKAISGVVEADRGAVILDGRDVTHAPPNEIAALGISQMPGGQGVFGGLTVQENLQLAGWTRHRDPVGRDAAMEEVLVLFPLLRERLHRPAADLSGGQQQMLALGMAFVAQPRVLLIDELSLGLAPVVVGQLLPIVQRVAQQGTAVILVEQSVNVALSVAERAYFMERGTIRFSGPTADLLGRKDLLRSVFLSGAAEPDGTATAVRRDSATDENVAPLLRVNEIAVAFGGNRAVNGATFDVRSHEIVGLIGPNGAGKTTIFDLVSGFVAVDSGRIELQGRDITNLGASERAAAGLGRSFQDARLFPDVTVSETLAVSLERWVNSRSARCALRLPACSTTRSAEHALSDRADEPRRLSQLVRASSAPHAPRVVDLACIAAHRPVMVLLDEPSSGIAQREVEALAPVLRRLRDEMGASLLVIEHDIPLISSISDRLVALDQGAVLTEGAPADVLAHPDVIESYLGNNPAARERSGTRG